MDTTTIVPTDATLNALDRAITFHVGRDATPDSVLECARKFEAYLTGSDQERA